MLKEQNAITIHQRNLQVLMTEVYKIVNVVAPPIIKIFFVFAATHTTSEILPKFLQKIGKP